jgi:DNA polymerase
MDVTAARFVPDTCDLARLAAAARQCQGCPLYEGAHQTVFGMGPATASLMLVGEQPGDQEDRQGMPFVGPAHFKFVRAERGARPIHRAPSRLERFACRPWLLAEIDAVTADLLVLVGATAAAFAGLVSDLSFAAGSI